MGKYKVTTEDGKNYMVTTEDGPMAGPVPQSVLDTARQNLNGPSSGATAPETPFDMSGVKGVGQGLMDLLKAVPSTAAAAVMPPKTPGEKWAAILAGPGGLAAKRMLQPNVDSAQQAVSDFRNGSPLTGTFHAATALAPIAGPMAEGAFQQASQGDTAGALARGMTNVAGMALAPKVIPKLVEGAQRVAGRVGDIAGNAVIEPTAKQGMFHNPGSVVGGELGPSLAKETIRPKLAAVQENLGKTIDAILSQPENRVGVISRDSLLQPAQDAIALANKYEKPAIASDLERVVRIVKKEFPNQNLEPLEATKLKRFVGDETKFDISAAPEVSQIANDARQGIYAKARAAVENLVPEVGPLNERYGNATEALTALDKAIAAKKVSQGVSPHAGMVQQALRKTVLATPFMSTLASAMKVLAGEANDAPQIPDIRQFPQLAAGARQMPSAADTSSVRGVPGQVGVTDVSRQLPASANAAEQLMQFIRQAQTPTRGAPKLLPAGGQGDVPRNVATYPGGGAEFAGNTATPWQESLAGSFKVPPRISGEMIRDYTARVEAARRAHIMDFLKQLANPQEPPYTPNPPAVSNISRKR